MFEVTQLHKSSMQLRTLLVSTRPLCFAIREFRFYRGQSTLLECIGGEFLSATIILE
jgi:hypothetical protein